jgi:hypothetical protein
MGRYARTVSSRIRVKRVPGRRRYIGLKCSKPQSLERNQAPSPVMPRIGPC